MKKKLFKNSSFIFFLFIIILFVIINLVPLLLVKTNKNDVKLIDREVLKTLLEKTDVKVATERQKYSATIKENAQEIERKYPYWI